jgi:hypothetical protein
MLQWDISPVNCTKNTVLNQTEFTAVIRDGKRGRKAIGMDAVVHCCQAHRDALQSMADGIGDCRLHTTIRQPFGGRLLSKWYPTLRRRTDPQGTKQRGETLRLAGLWRVTAHFYAIHFLQQSLQQIGAAP